MQNENDIEALLKEAAEELRREVPDTWTHPDAENLLAELKASVAAPEEEKKTGMGKLLTFPLIASNIGTGIAACLITALSVTVYQESKQSNLAMEPAAPAGQVQPSIGNMVTRGAPASDTATALSPTEVGTFIREFDLQLAERAKTALADSAASNEYSVLEAREELLSALTQYLAGSLAEKAAPAQAREAAYRWLEVLEANRDQF